MNFKKLLFTVTALGLFGTVTNFVYLSALPSVLCVIFPFLFLYRDHVPAISFSLLLFFVFALVSTAIYAPLSFLNFRYYRYDGNFIISYLPLLVLPLLSFNLDINKLLYRFYLFATIVNVLFFGYYLIRIGGQINAINSYGSLFIARNAAGGFLSFICSIGFIRAYSYRNKPEIMLFLVNMFILFCTFSRGSLLGLFAGIALFYMYRSQFRRFTFVPIILALAVQLCLVYYFFPTYQKTDYYASGIAVGQVTGAGSTKEANVFIRLYWCWPSAIDLFLHSPLLGAGFGSVNDIPYIFDSPIGLFNLNKQPNHIYGDNHAHHTYFHILGEMGLLGLGLLLYFQKKLLNFFNSPSHYPLIKDLLLMFFFNLLVMSLTEHRFVTPSNALPFSLLTGLLFAQINYDKKQAKQVLQLR